MKLTAFIFMCLSSFFCYGNNLEKECNKLDPQWLEIAASDLKEICKLVKVKDNEYTIHGSAPSHKDIYDFPMIEIHFLPKDNEGKLEGPVYFYWKRTEKWEELKEVSCWKSIKQPNKPNH